MAQELDQMKRNVDSVSRQVTVLSRLSTGQHEAAREAEESAGHIKPIVCVVDSETGGIIRGEFVCVKSDGVIMIVTVNSMMEWTRGIIAQRRRAVMEKMQDDKHCISKSIPGR